MSTHNICFYGKLEKIIPELSLNTPPYQVPCILVLSDFSMETHVVDTH